MIDRSSRNRLAESIRHLVTGQITNDEFVDRAPDESFDPAVGHLWDWAHSFYSDDDCYRLRGPHAIPRQFRVDVARAIVFLYSNFEYEWPKYPRSIAPFWGLWGLAFYLVLGFILLFIGLASAIAGELECFTVFGGIGLALVSVVAYHLATRPARIREDREWRALGDFDAWPFFRATDFVKARKLPALLSGKALHRGSDPFRDDFA
jgi:hypothetical protein